MKHILKLVIILCFFSLDAQAQCVDQFLTTTPTVNYWDWRTTPTNPNWRIDYIGTGGGIVRASVKSPFEETNNPNTFPIAYYAEKEYQPTDGWELVAKRVGISANATDIDDPTPNPYVILYNKNTARLRIFLLVVQLYSEIGNTTTNEFVAGGHITVEFKDDRNVPYQSNLLTTNTSPMLPLDKFTRDLNMVMVNSFINITPYWLYTDVPVAYDPCTCLNKGTLLIRANLNQGATVNLQILGVPRTSPVTNTTANSAGFLNGFSNFSNFVKGGFEVATAANANILKLDKSIQANIGLNIGQPLQAILTNDLNGLRDAVDLGLGFVSMIPQVGSAVSSVVSLVDYFVSGGKSSKGSSPSGVMIMNDFKATGTITSAVQKTAITVAILGSNQSLVNQGLKPIYNNTLGVFNLLRTPEVSHNRFGAGRELISSRRLACGEMTYKYKYLSDVYTKLEPNVLNEAISYVVNPAIYPDLELSDIRVAIQVAGIGKSDGGNMIAETKTTITLPNGTTAITDLYRTEYYPIGQATGLVAHVRAITSEMETDPDEDDEWGPFSNKCNSPIFRDFYVFEPQMSIKIVARIKRKNTTKPEEDIIFIATYPVKYHNIPMTQPPSFSNPDLSDMFLRGFDVARGFNGRYGNPALNIIKKGNIVLENGRIFAGAGGLGNWGPYPQSILTQAYNITMTNDDPNNDFVIETTAGDIVFEAKNTAYQAPVSPANVFAFCNSTDYKVASRNQSKTVETQAETPKDVPTSSSKPTQLLFIYPNPTTGEATITYEVDKEGSSVSIYLTNNLGIRVMEVSNEVSQAQGTHNVRIDTRNLSAGVYFYTLVLNGVAYTERLVVIK